jgi:hypothetical protein
MSKGFIWNATDRVVVGGAYPSAAIAGEAIAELLAHRADSPLLYAVELPDASDAEPSSEGSGS